MRLARVGHETVHGFILTNNYPANAGTYRSSPSMTYSIGPQ
jgi:hypothetical protein